MWHLGLFQQIWLTAGNFTHVWIRQWVHYFESDFLPDWKFLLLIKAWIQFLYLQRTKTFSVKIQKLHCTILYFSENVNSNFLLGVNTRITLETYAIVIFQKIWHNSNFAQVTSQHAYCQLYTYIQESPAEIQTVTQWNLIGHSMTAHCLCYLPAIFFCHIDTTAVSFHQGKIWLAFKKCYHFLYFFFKKTA